MDMSKMPTDGRKRETPQERAARLSNNSLDLALKADLNLCCQILRSIPKETVPDVKSLLLNRKKWFVTPEGKLDAETVTRLGGTIRGPLGQALDAEGQPLKMLVDGAIGESPPEGVMNFTPKKLEELKEKFIWKPEENWLSQPLLKKKEVFLNDLDADKISMVTSKIEPTSLSLANQGAMRQGSQRKPPREKNLELTEFTTMRDKYFRIDGFGCYLELISYLHELNLAQGRPAAELMLSAGQHNWIEKKSGWWGLLYVATEKKLYLWFKDTSYKALITEVPDAAAAELYTVQFPFSLMRGRVEKTDSSMNARLCFDYFPNDPSDPVRIQMARVPERLKPQTPPSSSTGVRRRQFRGSGGGASAAAAGAAAGADHSVEGSRKRGASEIPGAQNYSSVGLAGGDAHKVPLAERNGENCRKMQKLEQDKNGSTKGRKGSGGRKAGKNRGQKIKAIEDDPAKPQPKVMAAKPKPRAKVMAMRVGPAPTGAAGAQLVASLNGKGKGKGKGKKGKTSTRKRTGAGGRRPEEEEEEEDEKQEDEEEEEEEVGEEEEEEEDDDDDDEEEEEEESDDDEEEEEEE